MALDEKKALRTKAKTAWTKRITEATGLLSKAGQSDKLATLRDNIVQLYEHLLTVHREYAAEVAEAVDYEGGLTSKQSEILTLIQKYIERDDAQGDARPSSKHGRPASKRGSRASSKQSELRARATAMKAKQEIQRRQLELEQEAARADLQLEMDLAQSDDDSLHDDRSGVRDDKVEEWLHKQDAPVTATATDVLKDMLDSLHVPRAEMVCFDGDPCKYKIFVQAFEDNIGSKPIDDSAKLTRLFQYCKGRAYKVIEPCALMSNGYAHAKEMLHTRFGKKDVICQTWLEKVCYGGKVREESMRDFADELNVFKFTLISNESLREVNQQNLRQIAERLPVYMQHQWKKDVFRVRSNGAVPTLCQLVDLVARNAEMIADPVYGTLGRKKLTSTSNYQKSSSFNTETISTSDKSVRPCVLCEGSHTLFKCDDFKKMDPRDRFNLAKNNRLCYNCLKSGHSTRDCRLERSCNAPGCKLKHTKFLHISNENRRSDNGNAQSQSEVVTMQSSSAGGNNKMVLPVVRVRAYRDDGSYVTTNALVDNGSTNSFCSQRLLKELRMESFSHEISFVTLDGQRTESVQVIHKIDVSSTSGQIIQLRDVYSKKDLNISKHNIVSEDEVRRWSHLDGVPIPKYEEIDLLVGQDCPSALIPLEVRKHKSVANAPYAVRTELGWLISGPVHQSEGVVTCNYLSNEALQSEIEKYWKVDDVTFDDRKCPSLEDKKAEIMFNESVRQVNGHYEIAIPFKCDDVVLQNNKPMALGRLNSLKVKLRKDESLHTEYAGQISNLISKQYAEKVPTEVLVRNDDRVWYLPHHPVMHPRKKKMRIVFDCAAKHNNVSLNSKILQGPDYTNSLVGVLLRFRNYPVAVMSDIEGMFHQVKVPVEERDVLRFLWWQDGDMDKAVVEYRMTSHLFGGTWSPSVSNYALRKTAEDNKGQFSSEVLSVVNNNFYVDDCMFSVEKVSEAVEMSCELRELLSKGGFRLHKFSSNKVSVLENIPESERAENMRNLNFEALPVETALGVYWNLETDQFEYKVNPKEKPLTRRGVLSMMCSIYDPLGFVCPLTIVLKIMNQDLTRSKYSWDEPLDEMSTKQWVKWMSDLRQMEKFTVPRCIKPEQFGNVVRCELHHFSDASEVAYGAASYVRLVNESGQVSCSLLIAKSRVSPIKQMSIPRLELSAATVSVKLDIMLRRELAIKIDESVFWSDSQIVIAYINNESRRFNTFVANRLAVIHSASMASQWKYVKSEDNPGDDISRGKTSEELVSNERWLNGPEFLQHKDYNVVQPEIALPCDDIEVKVSNSEKSRLQVLACDVVEDSIHQLIVRCSSWNILRRRIAILIKFVEFVKTKAVKSKVITVKELEEASSAVIRYAQHLHYSEELTSIQRGKRVKKVSSIYQLEPLLSETGELCTGGRTGQHQVIVPKSHHIAKLLVEHYHAAGHCGREYVVAQLRERYWIVGIRSIVRSVLKQCYRCKINHEPAAKQRMSDLPKERIRADEPPFSYVGVDYFGPYLVKRARSTVKRYGCVFVCLNSKAIHIEVAHSLDTDSCINAIERFISRRGRPIVIYSDNGTNFVGADRELRESLQEFDQDKIDRQLSGKNIQWKFNPPSASHMGGIWERQIRSIRRVLAGVIKEQSLDDEKLSTLMCIVESILNNRPLTMVSSDINDLEALTPNHILLMRSNAAVSRGVFGDHDNYTRRRWRQVQYLADLFWKRWIREYLPNLQLRSKWIEPSPNMNIGDLVLVVDNNVPRCHWNLGRITEVVPGRDNNIRIVKVKTKSGVYLRPIHKLCLLERNI